MLGLTYTGTYRHYSRSSYYDGSDQALSLGLSERLSKRLQFNLRVQAGEFSRNYTTPVAPGIVDTSSVPIPNSQLFDNRVEYGSTGADLAVRLSSRWSFNIGGDAVLERYRSVLLYGVTQTGVHSDVAYRYSRFGTIGAAYAFEHFSFTKGFGASDVHAASIVWSIRLSHTWELAARGGVGRVESLGLQVVTVDPIVAVITGQSFGVTAAYHLNYVPDVSMSLSHMFQYSNLQFGYSRGTTPGNGVYLTSAQESASVGYRYSGLQHWSLDATGGYTSLRPLVQSLSNYHGYSGGVGVARTLRGGVQLVMRTEWRRFDNGGTFFRRNSARATLGFAWSPGDIPLSLW